MINFKKNDFFSPHKKEGIQKNTPKKKILQKKRKVRALMSWKIKDLEKTSKNTKFFLYLYSFLFLLTVYGLLTNNLLLSILVIVFGFAFFLFEKKQPQIVIFAVTKDGIFIHDHLYTYRSLKSFWIEYQPEGLKEVSFRSSQIFLPYIKVPLGETDPTALRKQLLKFLPEEEHPPGFSDFLDRF